MVKPLLEKLLDPHLNCHRLITTRPHSLELLRASLTGKEGAKAVVEEYELLGFDDKDIPLYVADVFSRVENPPDTDPFVKELKDNPSAWGLAHIPVQLSFMCYVRQQDAKINLAFSLTHLYERLSYYLFKSFLHKLYQVSETTLSELDSEELETLSTRLYGLIGTLAFEQFKNNSYAFFGRDAMGGRRASRK